MTNVIMVLFLSNLDMLVGLNKPEGPSEAINTALTKGRALSLEKESCDVWDTCELLPAPTWELRAALLPSHLSYGVMHRSYFLIFLLPLICF